MVLCSFFYTLVAPNFYTVKRPIRFLFFLISISSLAQHIQWQQSLGGEREEHLYDAISTYDYGILLAGSSVSEANGNKKDGNVADLDYWLWKMTEDGKLEWQKNYGGAGNDYLYSVSYTLDGGYILGGSSDSPEGHDKDTTGSGGLDFWILKLNPRGEIEWQKTFGGSENERLTAIAQSKNGGYWVAGTSSSTGLGNEEVLIVSQTLLETKPKSKMRVHKKQLLQYLDYMNSHRAEKLTQKEIDAVKQKYVFQSNYLLRNKGFVHQGLWVYFTLTGLFLDLILFFVGVSKYYYYFIPICAFISFLRSYRRELKAKKEGKLLNF